MDTIMSRGIRTNDPTAVFSVASGIAGAMRHCRLIAAIVIVLVALAGVGWILLVTPAYMD